MNDLKALIFIGCFVGALTMMEPNAFHQGDTVALHELQKNIKLNGEEGIFERIKDCVRNCFPCRRRERREEPYIVKLENDIPLSIKAQTPRKPVSPQHLKKRLIPLNATENIVDRELTEHELKKYDKLYLVGHTRSTCHVAKCGDDFVKVIFAPTREDNVTKSEVQMLAKLRGKPFVVNVREILETSRHGFHEIFVVMEQNKPLNDVIDREEYNSKVLMRDILEAVDSLHKLDIVHADLKPENILVDDNDQVKLADFGAARETGQIHEEEVGTSMYWAPEAAAKYRDRSKRGEMLTKDTDMWAVGCIFFNIEAKQRKNKFVHHHLLDWYNEEPMGNFVSKQIRLLRKIHDDMDGFHTKLNAAFTGDTESEKFVALLKRLLSASPRVTASEALKDPFFEN
jgi:serine/threonine protein kinase